jgi:hypothetical protein
MSFLWALWHAHQSRFSVGLRRNRLHPDCARTPFFLLESWPSSRLRQNYFNSVRRGSAAILDKHGNPVAFYPSAQHGERHSLRVAFIRFGIFSAERLPAP